MDVVLSLVELISEAAGEPPCKKTIQKIVYLIQEAGVDLGFDYSIHFYGPYSADLDSEIRYLSSYGDLDIDTSHVTDEVKDVVFRFASRSPSDLELLATALYVQREMPDAQLKDIVEGVTEIKREKYPVNQIRSAIYELEEEGYFQFCGWM